MLLFTSGGLTYIIQKKTTHHFDGIIYCMVVLEATSSFSIFTYLIYVLMVNYIEVVLCGYIYFAPVYIYTEKFSAKNTCTTE